MDGVLLGRGLAGRVLGRHHAAAGGQGFARCCGGCSTTRLAERFGLARASLLLGVIAGIWHLPLFAVPGHANYGQPFWLFVLGSTALSVAMAWLFVNTRGSVGLAMLKHARAEGARAHRRHRAAHRVRHGEDGVGVWTDARGATPVRSMSGV